MARTPSGRGEQVDVDNSMSDFGAVGSIRQQIGEILGTVRSLSVQVREQRDDSRRQEERLDTQLATVKEEQNRTNTAVQARLDQLNAAVREIDEKAKVITRDVGSLSQDVANLKGPVDTLMQTRTKIIAYLAVVVGAFTVFWTFVGPLVHSFAEKLFLK